MDEQTRQRIDAKVQELKKGSTVIYHGLFFDMDDVQQTAAEIAGKERLSRAIQDPHITYGFRQKMSSDFIEQLGKPTQTLTKIIGYGNDGKNEGFLVALGDSDKAMVGNTENMHVTISVAEKAKPVNTRFIEFKPIEKEVGLAGRLGYFGADNQVHYTDPDKIMQEKIEEVLAWGDVDDWRDGAETFMAGILYNTELANDGILNARMNEPVSVGVNEILENIEDPTKPYVVAIQNKESGTYELYRYNEEQNIVRPLIKTDKTPWTFDDVKTSMFVERARCEAVRIAESKEFVYTSHAPFEYEQDYQKSRKFDEWIENVCENVGYTESELLRHAEEHPADFANLISMSDEYAEYGLLKEAFSDMRDPNIDEIADKYAMYEGGDHEYGYRKEPPFMAFCRNLEQIEQRLDKIDHEKFWAVYDTVYGQDFDAELPKVIRDRMDNFELTVNPWKQIGTDDRIDPSMSYESIANALSQKYQIAGKSGQEIGCEATPDGIKQYMQVVKEIAARDYEVSKKAGSIKADIDRTLVNVVKTVNKMAIADKSAAREKPEQEKEKVPIDKDRPILYVPVAIPGAGKSTWAKTNEYCNLAFSSDEVRKELGFGAGKGNNIVFSEVNRRTVEALRSGKSCIYDATNLDFHREELVRSIKEQVPNVRTVAVVFHVPLEECLERNAAREGFARVPDHIIKRMSRQMTLPTKEAGFDNIIDLKWDKDHEIEAQRESMDKFADEVRNEDRNKDIGVGYGED